MARTILSVSIQPHQQDFISKRGYSPSRLLQKKIEELMAGKSQENLLNLETKMQSWKATAESLMRWIEKNGLKTRLEDDLSSAGDITRL